MSEENKNIDELKQEVPNTESQENIESGGKTEQEKELSTEDKLTEAESRIAELEKDRLYKQAEFDNYRKQQIKKQTELILNGGRKVLEAMLPVIDDMERALQHMENADDVQAIKEGVELIQKKFLSVMKSQGVTPMETQGADFNTDFHEAVTQFPAPSDELKGKVIDCTEKGYMLNDTVLRFAKVVVGV